VNPLRASLAVMQVDNLAASGAPDVEAPRWRLPWRNRPAIRRRHTGGHEMGISMLLKSPEALFRGVKDLFTSDEELGETLAHLSYTNGLLTAVMIGPEPVPQSEWLPMLMQMPDDDPDPDLTQLAVQMTLHEYKAIYASLADGNGYEPVFWTNPDGRLITKDWAAGFLRGAEFRRKAWARILDVDNSAIEKFLYFLMQIEELDEQIRLSGEDPDELRKDAKQEVTEIVDTIFALSQERPQTGPVLRAAKIGRNDPCPCGSGKKYKKCCLN
jgi:uncharacterized protein